MLVKKNSSDRVRSLALGVGLGFLGLLAAGPAMPGTVTVDGSESGTGTVTGGAISCSVNDGVESGTCVGSVTGTITLTATPTGTSVFNAWDGCDAPAGNDCVQTVGAGDNEVVQPRFYRMNNLYVGSAITGSGGGVITADVGGINCTIVSQTESGTCVATLVDYTPFTITATPDSSSVLSGWEGCTGAVGNTCSGVITENRAPKPIFILKPQTLGIEAASNGTGDVTSSAPHSISCRVTNNTKESGVCSETVALNEVVTLTATPINVHHRFDNWVGCDAPAGNTCVQTIGAATEIVQAKFTRKVWHKVFGQGGGDGSVTSPELNCDVSNGVGAGDCVVRVWEFETRTATATPAANSVFSGWSGCPSPAGNTCTQTMGGINHLKPIFNLAYHNLTLEASGAGNGTITSSAPNSLNCTSTAGIESGTCVESVEQASVVTLTANPSAGFSFRGWTGCDAPAGNTCVQTVGAPETVSAEFGLPDRALTIGVLGTSTGRGLISSDYSMSCSIAGTSTSGTCSETVLEGTFVTVTATPDPFVSFLGWNGCDAPAGNVCVQHLSGSDEALSAAFSAPLRNLEVDGTGGGSGAITSSAPNSISCMASAGTETGTCSEGVYEGDVVTLTASPTGGSVFDSWAGCDAPAGNVCVQTVSGGDESVRAVFSLASPPPASRVIAIEGSGDGYGQVTASVGANLSCVIDEGLETGSCSAVISDGTVVTLSATSVVGSTFDRWLNCDSPSGLTCVQTVSGSDEFPEAVFIQASSNHALSVSGSSGVGSIVSDTTISCATDAGSDAGTCSEVLANWSVVTITATPDPGYQFSGWSGCDAPAGNICTQTISSADESVQASFSGLPDIDVQGQGVSIANGDLAPSDADGTDFGSAPVGSLVSRVFTIRNTGIGDLVLGSSAASISGSSDFTISSQPVSILSAGQEASVTVEFRPSSAGAKAASLVIFSNDADEDPYQFQITGSGDSLGSLTIEYNSPGLDRSLSFTSATPALNFSMAVSSGSGVHTVSGLPAGSYSIQAEDLSSHGYVVTKIVCDNAGSSSSVKERAANIVLAAQEDLTCVFTSREVREATRKIISEFQRSRNSLILSYQPRASRRIDKLRFGGPGPQGTVSFWGNPLFQSRALDLSISRNSFSALMLSTRSAPGYKHNPRPGKHEKVLYEDPEVIKPARVANPWDVWAEVYGARIKNASGKDGRFFIGHLGVDYLGSSDRLYGVTVQFDNYSYFTPGSDAEIDSVGFMFGPYATLRLREGLLFDGMIKAGRSYNKIKPFGTYEDDFETNRLLAQASLVGDLKYKRWGFEPAVGIKYIYDKQLNYTDDNGINIGDQVNSQGDATLGQKLSYTFVGWGGRDLSVWGAIDGNYSFYEISGEAGPSTSGRYSADVSFGVDYGGVASITLRKSGYGTDYRSFGAGFSFNKQF